MIETQGKMQTMVLFGFGDIGQCSAIGTRADKEYMAMAYYQLETPQAIGTPTKDARATKEIMCSAPVVFMFANTESLDVVIKNLRTIKKKWIKRQQEQATAAECREG
jgi:hypothetical protein